ncbi:hypothetical protein HDU84_002751 [Entophlyctis sp. JEL0112]|nr:hypothetical protein HDU84_002751 [Entophlyctis sp. JEL0112]
MVWGLLKCLVPAFLIQDGPHIRLIPIGNVRECRSLQQIKDRYPNACYEQQQWSLLSYFQWLSFFRWLSFFPWPSATTTVYLYRDGNRLTYPEGAPAEINTAAEHLREGRRLVIIAFANIDQGKDQLKELGRSRVAEYHRDKADRIRIIVLQNTFGTLDEEDLIFIGEWAHSLFANDVRKPGCNYRSDI